MKYPLAVHFLLTSTLTSYTKHTHFNNIIQFLWEFYTNIFDLFLLPLHWEAILSSYRNTKIKVCICNTKSHKTATNAHTRTHAHTHTTSLETSLESGPVRWILQTMHLWRWTYIQMNQPTRCNSFPGLLLVV